MRGRQRYAQSVQGLRSSACACTVSRGSRTAFPVLVVAIAFAGPLAQLLSWVIDSWDDPLVRDGFGTWARNSLMLGTIAALIVVPTALVLVYGLRLAPSRLNRVTARLATIGYGVPGSVVAVGVLLSLAWVDHRIQDLGEVAGSRSGLFTGSALGMVFAVVRFLRSASSRSRRRWRDCHRPRRRRRSRARRRPSRGDVACPPAAAARGAPEWRAARVRRDDQGAARHRAVATAGGDTPPPSGSPRARVAWQAAAPPAVAIILVALVPVLSCLCGRSSAARPPRRSRRSG